MAMSRVRPRFGKTKEPIPRPSSAPPLDSEIYTVENDNEVEPKLINQSASPFVLKKSDDSASSVSLLNQFSVEILRLIQINSQLKDVSINNDYLMQLIDQTLQHVIAESKEVLSWIPVAPSDTTASEVPLTVIHYKHQLFATMRDVGLKAHNAKLDENFRYFNNRAIHIQDLKSISDQVHSRFLHDVNRRNNDLQFNKDTRVIIPQCVTSDFNYAPNELKNLLLAYLERGITQIQLYIGRNADGEPGEQKKQKWFKENAWLDDFMKAHPEVSYYTREELLQTESYLLANSVFDEQLLSMSDIKKALQDDVVKHLCRRLKKENSSLVVPKSKSLPNSPVVLPLPEGASAAAASAVDDIPLLERQASDGSSHTQMVNRLCLVAKVPELKQMTITHPSEFGAFCASFFYNADMLKNKQKSPKSPPKLSPSPEQVSLEAAPNTIKVRA